MIRRRKIQACLLGSAVVVVAACGSPEVNSVSVAGPPPRVEGVEVLPPLDLPGSPTPVRGDLENAKSGVNGLAQNHPDKLSWPYIDDGHVVVTAVDRQGFALVEREVAAGRIPEVPMRHRIVERSAGEMSKISEELLKMTEEQVPGADSFVMVSGDEKNNRAVVTSQTVSTEMLLALRKRYGPGAVVVRHHPSLARPSVY